MMNIHQHLRERNTFAHQKDMFVGDDCVDFIIRNFKGTQTGKVRYRPDGVKREKDKKPGDNVKYSVSRDSREQGVYGVFSLENQLYAPIILCEGVFDAIRFHNLQLCAVAVLQNNPKALRNQLKLLNRPTFAVCEKGPGELLAKYADQHIVLPEYKDPSNLGRRELWNLRNEILTKTWPDCNWRNKVN